MQTSASQSNPSIFATTFIETLHTHLSIQKLIASVTLAITLKPKAHKALKTQIALAVQILCGIYLSYTFDETTLLYILGAWLEPEFFFDFIAFIKSACSLHIHIQKSNNPEIILYFDEYHPHNLLCFEYCAALAGLATSYLFVSKRSYRTQSMIFFACNTPYVLFLCSLTPLSKSNNHIKQQHSTSTLNSSIHMLYFKAYTLKQHAEFCNLHIHIAYHLLHYGFYCALLTCLATAKATRHYFYIYLDMHTKDWEECTRVLLDSKRDGVLEEASMPLLPAPYLIYYSLYALSQAFTAQDPERHKFFLQFLHTLEPKSLLASYRGYNLWMLTLYCKHPQDARALTHCLTLEQLSYCGQHLEAQALACNRPDIAILLSTRFLLLAVTQLHLAHSIHATLKTRYNGEHYNYEFIKSLITAQKSHYQTLYNCGLFQKKIPIECFPLITQWIPADDITLYSFFSTNSLRKTASNSL